MAGAGVQRPIHLATWCLLRRAKRVNHWSPLIPNHPVRWEVAWETMAYRRRSERWSCFVWCSAPGRLEELRRRIVVGEPSFGGSGQIISNNSGPT